MRSATAIALARFGQRPIRAIEVGVQFGIHALELKENLRFDELVLCDIWAPYVSCGVPFDFSKSYDDVKELFKDSPEVTVFKGSCIGVGGDFDFVYVDGNHSLPYVLEDLRNLFPRVRKGGLLAGHDFSASGTEVALAVLAFASEKGLALHLGDGFDTDWWFEL